MVHTTEAAFWRCVVHEWMGGWVGGFRCRTLRWPGTGELTCSRGERGNTGKDEERREYSPTTNFPVFTITAMFSQPGDTKDQAATSK
jgi:hypothetical protein